MPGMTSLLAAAESAAALRIPALGLTVLLGLFIPVVVGLLTKYRASATVKGVVNIVLTGVAGLVTASTAGDTAVISWDALLYAGIAWAISVASYLGIYQSVDINAKTAPNAGIG